MDTLNVNLTTVTSHHDFIYNRKIYKKIRKSILYKVQNDKKLLHRLKNDKYYQSLLKQSDYFYSIRDNVEKYLPSIFKFVKFDYLTT